jgi:8-oxo-dGTP diphosphatase
MTTYKSPSLTTDAIVLRKHKTDSLHDILLVTRGHDPFKDHLAFPGGFVEYGEEPGKGCLRELKEETNLDGKNLELLTIRGEANRDPRKLLLLFMLLKLMKMLNQKEMMMLKMLNFQMKKLN